MKFTDARPARLPVTERRTAPRAQGSSQGTPIPPLADFEYANSLGVEYFSLVIDCRQATSAPEAASRKKAQ
jgi:hypothetical protein